MIENLFFDELEFLLLNEDDIWEMNLVKYYINILFWLYNGEVVNDLVKD